MALARILALARIARGFAGARTFAGVDPHAHDGFSRLLGGSRGGGQAADASAIAATARVAPDAIFVFMLLISS
jgi:hypothetical protein